MEGMTVQHIEKELRQVGYRPRRRELLALAGTFAATGAGARAMLLEGPPGAGKSYLAECVAKFLNATFIPYLCHSWTDNDEMFVGVDVVSAVAGDAESTRQDGILASAARASTKGFVVLLIDEIDKAPERAENLFLDWLQSGRVPIKPGIHLDTNLEKCLVFFTSNAARPLGIAFPRRVRRVFMEALTIEEQLNWFQEKSKRSPEVIKVAWKLARQIAEGENNQNLSLQEGHRLLDELDICDNFNDVVEVLASWAARTPEGFKKARAKSMRDRISALWALLNQERRRVDE